MTLEDLLNCILPENTDYNKANCEVGHVNIIDNRNDRKVHENVELRTAINYFMPEGYFVVKY